MSSNNNSDAVMALVAQTLTEVSCPVVNSSGPSTPTEVRGFYEAAGERAADGAVAGIHGTHDMLARNEPITEASIDKTKAQVASLTNKVNVALEQLKARDDSNAEDNVLAFVNMLSATSQLFAAKFRLNTMEQAGVGNLPRSSG